MQTKLLEQSFHSKKLLKSADEPKYDTDKQRDGEVNIIKEKEIEEEKENIKEEVNENEDVSRKKV